MGFSIEEIKEKLYRYHPVSSVMPADYRAASVLIPFYENSSGLSLVFMKRPDRPEPHGGQISFPGGGREPLDENSLMTALRETEEEYGIHRDGIDVWGKLKSRGTRASYYWISPFVGQIPSDSRFQPNPDEVERLIMIPFDHLMSDDNYSIGDFPWREGIYTSHIFRFNDDIIWGLTAKILASFITFLKTGQEAE